MDADVFVAAAVGMFQSIATLRAQVTLDVDAVVLLDFGSQLMWNQMERLLVHRAVFNRVDRPGIDACPLLKSALQHRHNRRLAAPDRAHQEKDTLAHFKTLRGTLEIF